MLRWFRSQKTIEACRDTHLHLEIKRILYILILIWLFFLYAIIARRLINSCRLQHYCSFNVFGFYYFTNNLGAPVKSCSPKCHHTFLFKSCNNWICFFQSLIYIVSFSRRIMCQFLHLLTMTSESGSKIKLLISSDFALMTDHHAPSIRRSIKVNPSSRGVPSTTFVSFYPLLFQKKFGFPSSNLYLFITYDPDLPRLHHQPCLPRSFVHGIVREKTTFRGPSFALCGERISKPPFRAHLSRALPLRYRWGKRVVSLPPTSWLLSGTVVLWDVPS